MNLNQRLERIRVKQAAAKVNTQKLMWENRQKTNSNAPPKLMSTALKIADNYPADKPSAIEHILSILIAEGYK